MVKFLVFSPASVLTFLALKQQSTNDLEIIIIIKDVTYVNM